MANKLIIHPTQWGDEPERLGGLIKPEFVHVHSCQAAIEERECMYDWTKHNLTTTTGECDCFPEIDCSDVRAQDKQVVFIVHRGVC